MRRGRKPKPTNLRKLGGNAGKRKLPAAEPAPPTSDDLLVPSPWLEKLAKEEWRRIAPTIMSLGLLTVVDRSGLEGYCQAFARWRQAEQVLTKQGLCFKTPKGYVQQRPEVSIAQQYLHKMHSLAAEFGFTPASRTRVQGKKPSGDGDDLDAYLKGPGAEPGKGADAPGGSLH